MIHYFNSIILFAFLFVFPRVNSLFLYAIHDIVNNNSTPVETEQIIENINGKNFLELIEFGQNLSRKAHEKLSRHKNEVKMNKYRHLLIKELDHLEMLLKRSETLVSSIDNPFMMKLIEYTRSDLEITAKRFRTLIILYDQGDDQSMPALTNIVQQLINHSNMDVGRLNFLNFTKISTNLSVHSVRLQTGLQELKQKMDKLDDSEFSTQINAILVQIIKFENLIFEAEKRSNINSVLR